MNTVIFAGGTGRRLWPLSRQNSPKQFQVFKGEKSTLQMAVDRVREFGLDNVYISTNEKYTDTVSDQLPELDESHILTEPAKRDLAAAVCLSLLRLKQRGLEGATAMLWADHFMTKPDNFRQALEHGERLVEENPQQLVFLAEKPRFANENMGWIHLGEQIKENEYKFRGWSYRPTKEKCEQMYQSGEWMWNPGYFIFDLDYCIELYQEYEPEMFAKIKRMVADEQKLNEKYENIEQKHFDDAIAERVDDDQAVVLKTDLGWSDPGTLYALKEALTSSKSENLTKGSGDIVVEDTEDSFVYNEEDKLTTAIGLDGKMVINTDDVLLVCSKDNMKDIKSILKLLQEKGLEQYL
ncbi:MAG: mannose-1-phosphate guanylyltransferase [Candidatus Magasanikbacteria bacterium]